MTTKNTVADTTNSFYFQFTTFFFSNFPTPDVGRRKIHIISGTPAMFLVFRVILNSKKSNLLRMTQTFDDNEEFELFVINSFTLWHVSVSGENTVAVFFFLIELFARARLPNRNAEFCGAYNLLLAAAIFHWIPYQKFSFEQPINACLLHKTRRFG